MKCAACDVRLKAGESYWCAACAAEHAAGYELNRKMLLARLVGLLMLFQLRRYIQWGEVAQWMDAPRLPKASWNTVKIIAPLVLIVLLPALASAQSQVNLKLPITALVVGNLADSVSTEIALQRPGLKEGNPIMGQSAARRVLLKSAGTAVQVWLVRKIGRQHPKLATVIGYSAGVWLGGVAIHNARIGR